MKIPDDLFEKWKMLRSHGDGKKIAEQKGINIMDVSRAFTLQECSDQTFKAIADFYEAKKEMVNVYL